ncbi:MAG: BatD family protein, partial [FCB group bacterium]|nr:BatD family protein [FCB group bacterium]
MHFLAGIALAILGAATTAPVDVHVFLTPPEVPYYRQPSFTIQVDSPADLEVQLPDMSKKFGGIEVYGEPKRSTTALEDKRVRTEVTYVLDPVKPGDYSIEPVTVTWEPGGKAEVPSPALRVRDLTPEEEKSLARFEQIALPQKRGSPLAPWMAWALGGTVLAVALALLALRFLRRGRGPELKAIREP